MLSSISKDEFCKNDFQVIKNINELIISNYSQASLQKLKEIPKLVGMIYEIKNVKIDFSQNLAIYEFLLKILEIELIVTVKMIEKCDEFLCKNCISVGNIIYIRNLIFDNNDFKLSFDKNTTYSIVNNLFSDNKSLPKYCQSSFIKFTSFDDLKEVISKRFSSFVQVKELLQFNLINEDNLCIPRIFGLRKRKLYNVDKLKSLFIKQFNVLGIINSFSLSRNNHESNGPLTASIKFEDIESGDKIKAFIHNINENIAKSVLDKREIILITSCDSEISKETVNIYLKDDFKNCVIFPLGKFEESELKNIRKLYTLPVISVRNIPDYILYRQKFIVI